MDFMKDVPNTRHGRIVNCCNKDISLTYGLRSSRRVKHYCLCKCSPVDDRSSSRNSRLKSGRMTSSRSRSGTEIALPSRTEVFVRTDQAQTPTLQTSRVSYISKDSGGIYKAHDVTLNVDVELGPEQEK